ncbi:ABC transporter permease [Nocardioides sp. MAHUQ-72]|uniref:ABC transporter permease n=1 Tax=unclassified Nocardioides TaxID=2615069 RepID=UPI003619E811
MTAPPTVPDQTPFLLRSVYRKSLRDHRHGLVGWSVGIALLVVTESLIWPSFKDMPDIEKLFEQYPDYMQRLFDVSSMTSGLGFINSELFTLMLPALFLVYAIGRGGRLVAGEEEDGTLDVLLVTPLSSGRILLEKALALVTCVALLGVGLYAVTLGCSVAIGMGIGPLDTLSGCLAMVLLGSEFGLLALGVGAATGRRSLAVGVPAALAVAGYVLYVAGLLVEGVDPWQHLSPLEQALASGPLGGGLPVDFVWLALGCVVVAVATLPLLDRRDIAAPG